MISCTAADPMPDMPMRQPRARDAKVYPLGEFIDELFDLTARRQAHSLDSAERLKGSFSELLGEPLAGLSAWRLEAWRRDRLEVGAQSDALNQQLRTLAECLRKAVQWGLMDRNPVEDLNLKGETEYFIEFFSGGVGHSFLREGWSPIGINDTWTVGYRAVVALEGVPASRDYTLKIQVAGIFAPIESMYQRIVVNANQTTIGQVFCRGAASYEFMLPAALITPGQPLEIVLQLPDARRPVDYPQQLGDSRFLALRVVKIELSPLRSELQHPAGPTQRDVLQERATLQQMESLGVNCEFGFVQRSVGAESMGLFRWTFAPIEKLIPALERRLEGLEGRNNLNIEVDEASEFIVEDKVYGFRHHSFVFESQGGTRAQVERAEFLRIGLLTRALIQQLNEQSKLFVYHDAGQSGLADVRRLVNAIRSYGDNTLLWIVGSPDESSVGTARELETGLIQGYVSGFQPVDGGILPVSPHYPTWLSAACDAHRIWRKGKPI
jgi:hypothetical protein